MALSSGTEPIYYETAFSGQLVEKLRHLSGQPATLSVSLFMIKFANHIRMRGKKEMSVRTDTTDHFVEDLVEYGFLKLMP